MVQVIDLESVPLVERPHVREGVLRTRRLLTGEPGTPDNFSLQMSSTPTYYSPRHRHNFDQVRFQLEGVFDFALDGSMKPGTVAYFPEGTHYGPQSCQTGSTTLVLQFGGASGSGYLSAEQYEQAAADLAKHGTFAKGVYTELKPDGSKINKDAYEAVWEQVNGRPLKYPGERYLRPVFMDPESFEWIPIEDQAGASCKQLGEFSERRTRISLYKIAPEASLSLDEHSIYFVLAGAGTVDLKAFKRHTTIHLGVGEQLTAIASEPTELLQIGLPSFW
ncbi:MAG TPA: hypothetical protein VN822_03925 [Candidatus Acidoferrales bacterium]|nr:hypothetical protein [Candidatus Acidoferrales bacterium]